MHDVMVSIPSS